MGETRSIQVTDTETIEIRPLNTYWRTQHERALEKQNIKPGTNESGAELVRVLLVAWVKDGKDLVTLLTREKLRDEISQYDSLIMRVLKEGQKFAEDLGARYETDRKN